VGPCPALARERDWCHDAAAGQPGTPGARVDFSYLVLSTAPAVLPPAARVRVVSDQLVEKGRLKIFGCGPNGRHAYVRLDRAASPANAGFDRLARGDVADFGGQAPSEASDGMRVGAETEVRVVDIHEHVARGHAAP
jgi:hypothetical protein